MKRCCLFVMLVLNTDGLTKLLELWHRNRARLYSVVFIVPSKQIEGLYMTMPTSV